MGKIKNIEDYDIFRRNVEEVLNKSDYSEQTKKAALKTVVSDELLDILDVFREEIRRLSKDRLKDVDLNEDSPVAPVQNEVKDCKSLHFVDRGNRRVKVVPVPGEEKRYFHGMGADGIPIYKNYPYVRPAPKLPVAPPPPKLPIAPPARKFPPNWMLPF